MTLTYPWYYVIFDLVLWNVIFFALLYCVLNLHRKKLPSYYKTASVYNGFFILFLALAVFAYHTGDFSHYQEDVEGVYYRNDALSLEPFYGWLIELVKGKYYIWRLIVWGLYFAILRRVLISYKANSYLTLLIFSGLILPSAVEGRWVLGMVVFLSGYILLAHRGYGAKLLGLLLLALSVQLHNSMLMPLLLLPFSFIINVNKKYIIIGAILLFPFLTEILYKVFNVYLDNILGIDGAQQLVSVYFGEESAFRSTGATILRLFYIGCTIFLFIIVYRRMFLSRATDVLDRQLLAMAFLIIYSAAVAFFSGVGAFELAWRLFVMAPYPLVLLSGRILKEKFILTISFWSIIVTMFIWRNYNILLQMYYFASK